MKVIVAGLPKTGTKSMAKALTQLGYNVYDHLEQYEFLEQDWLDIMLKDGTTEQFRRMFNDIDAVTDVPASYYWDEIHKAFPDAKIILTTRDSEDEWFQSLRGQVDNSKSRWMVKFMIALSPTRNRLTRFGLAWWNQIFGILVTTNIFRKTKLNELTLKMKYRRHNAHVLSCAPRDKLLAFNVKDGWAPLCKFLGVDIPYTDFPHINISGNITDEFMKTSPIFRRMKQEVTVIASLLLGLLALSVCMLLAYIDVNNLK